MCIQILQQREGFQLVLYNSGERVNSPPTPNFISRKDNFRGYSQKKNLPHHQTNDRCHAHVGQFCDPEFMIYMSVTK
jgi:hypothetical protein